MRNFIRWLVRLVFNIIARVEPKGYENLPSEGSFVIATNHLGILDAPVAFYALDYWDMYVLVGEKWGKRAFFRWLGKYLNFIFIDRFNPDIKTLRKVISLMEQDNILVIAPEGTRSRVGSLIEAKPGVSYLASKLNRPIVPVAITGTEDEALFEISNDCAGPISLSPLVPPLRFLLSRARTVTRRSRSIPTTSCVTSQHCCRKNTAASMPTARG